MHSVNSERPTRMLTRLFISGKLTSSGDPKLKYDVHKTLGAG